MAQTIDSAKRLGEGDFGQLGRDVLSMAVGRGAVVLGKITQQLAKLVKLVMRIMSRVKGLFGQLGDALKRLEELGQHAPVAQRRR
ncbi:hypothetical protein [Lentzea albidocapillata]|uniref:Uncharacterized protein n=1 Tax=Lentzea albidocapillata TaxID=40571 RepID=A0A1W2FQ33_9PSEU|nr:hypothetical protein [Lentzea albidocapillata]SMD23973.1 hypothetical protein SAMN05660733_07504 [Lentzea albidocapillata]